MHLRSSYPGPKMALEMVDGAFIMGAQGTCLPPPLPSYFPPFLLISLPPSLLPRLSEGEGTAICRLVAFPTFPGARHLCKGDHGTLVAGTQADPGLLMALTVFFM